LEVDPPIVAYVWILLREFLRYIGQEIAHRPAPTPAESSPEARAAEPEIMPSPLFSPLEFQPIFLGLEPILGLLAE